MSRLTTSDEVRAEIGSVEERITHSEDSNELANLANRVTALKARLEKVIEEEAASAWKAVEGWLDNEAPVQRADLQRDQEAAEAAIMASLKSFKEAIQRWQGVLQNRRALEATARHKSDECDRQPPVWSPMFVWGPVAGTSLDPHDWIDPAKRWLAVLPTIQGQDLSMKSVKKAFTRTAGGGPTAQDREAARRAGIPINEPVTPAGGK